MRRHAMTISGYSWADAEALGPDVVLTAVVPFDDDGVANGQGDVWH